jgi:hypothetical protein
MRNVFVFARATLDQTRERIASLASDVQTDPWLINSAEDPAANPAIYVEIDTTGNVPEGLYRDWSPLELQALETAMGALPTWCVFCTVTGRIPGDAQIRAFVLELIRDGGVAVDDYSEHLWTAREIAQDTAVAGLVFFDYQTSYSCDRASNTRERFDLCFHSEAKALAAAAQLEPECLAIQIQSGTTPVSTWFSRAGAKWWVVKATTTVADENDQRAFADHAEELSERYDGHLVGQNPA